MQFRQSSTCFPARDSMDAQGWRMAKRTRITSLPIGLSMTQSGFVRFNKLSCRLENERTVTSR
jgi:hypothetical protein